MKRKTFVIIRYNIVFVITYYTTKIITSAYYKSAFFFIVIGYVCKRI